MLYIQIPWGERPVNIVNISINADTFFPSQRWKLIYWLRNRPCALRFKTRLLGHWLLRFITWNRYSLNLWHLQIKSVYLFRNLKHNNWWMTMCPEDQILAYQILEYKIIEHLNVSLFCLLLLLIHLSPKGVNVPHVYHLVCINFPCIAVRQRHLKSLKFNFSMMHNIRECCYTKV